MGYSSRAWKGPHLGTILGQTGPHDEVTLFPPYVVAHDAAHVVGSGTQAVAGELGPVNVEAPLPNKKVNNK